MGAPERLLLPLVLAGSLRQRSLAPECGLRFRSPPPAFPLVSTKGQAILEAIKALPSEERRQVLDEAWLLRERTREWDQQQAKLRDMQSRHAGRALLQRLLHHRAEERPRG